MASFGEKQRRRWRFPRSSNGVPSSSSSSSASGKENHRPDKSRDLGNSKSSMATTTTTTAAAAAASIRNTTRSLLDQEIPTTESFEHSDSDSDSDIRNHKNETTPLHHRSSGGNGRRPMPNPSRSERRGLLNSVEDRFHGKRNQKVPVSYVLRSFRENSAHFISSAYLMSSRDSIRSSVIDGSLFTSLADDVFGLVHAQLALLDEYLVSEHLADTDTGDAIVTDAWLSLFRTIACRQVYFGRSRLFLGDADSCIARANDYWILGEKAEHLMQTVWNRRTAGAAKEAGGSDRSSPEWDTATTLVETEAAGLIDRMNLDAVEAARHVAVSVIETVRKLDIPRELFGRHWEQDLTNNEVATYIVRVYARELAAIQRSLVSEYLYHKVVITLARCTICFYLKRFLSKAGRVRAFRALGGKPRAGVFQSPSKALLRMKYDLGVFRDFFGSLCEGTEAVSRILANDFSAFSVLFLECAGCALGENRLEEFVPVVHKRTGADADVTRHFLSDVSVVMGGGGPPQQQQHNRHRQQQQQQQQQPPPPGDSVAECLRTMHAGLEVIRQSVEAHRDTNDEDAGSTTNPAHFALDRMLKELYEERILQEKLDLCGNL